MENHTLLKQTGRQDCEKADKASKSVLGLVDFSVNPFRGSDAVVTSHIQNFIKSKFISFSLDGK